MTTDLSAPAPAPVELAGAQILQAAFEHAGSRGNVFLPKGLVPTIPTLVTLLAVVLALLALAQPVAAEATLRTHSNGHSTPGFATSDFIAAIEHWTGPVAPPAGDTTTPSVAFISPASGATVSVRPRMRSSMSRREAAKKSAFLDSSPSRSSG